MTTDLIHVSLACAFFVLCAVSCHITVVSRRTRGDGRASDVPLSGNSLSGNPFSGNIGQR